jgi:NAD(P)-dependent dehydrogenase (short-subunit alcohol dehydrogenase family)
VTARYASLADAGVLITGGASGIGAEMVRNFAQPGARVTFLDIDDAAAAAVVAETGASFTHCDLTDIAALRAAVAAADAACPIAVMVNNAARDDRHAVESVEPEGWRRALALNLDHQFFGAQAIAPKMAARGGGSIVLMGSVSWLRARTGMVGYTTAKAAINGMNRTLAREWGTTGVRVNCIMPGAVLTERQAALWRSPEIDRVIMESQALKITLRPAHIAAMALFLGSAESGGCTGQNFIVDAGISLN